MHDVVHQIPEDVQQNDHRTQNYDANHDTNRQVHEELGVEHAIHDATQNHHAMHDVAHQAHERMEQNDHAIVNISRKRKQVVGQAAPWPGSRDEPKHRKKTPRS